MRGYNFTWHGKYQHIRLDPFDTPFYIWQLSRVGAN
jgi:starch synthase (maltosyl-transferring)